MSFLKPNIDKLKKEKKVSELTECLDHKNSDVRFDAFLALANLPERDSAAIDKLKKMIDDNDVRIRTIATLTFADFNDKEISDNLLKIMEGGSRNDKLELLRIITSRGKTDNATIIKVIINGLVDKQDYVKLEAINASVSAKSDHVIPYLVECLHDEHHTIRINSAKALYEIGGDESVDYLIGLLVDNDTEVRKLARSYLSNINTDKARRAVEDVKFQMLLKGMNDREPVRKETAKKIGENKIIEGLPLLHQALQDQFKEVRLEALLAVAAFKSPSSIEFIEKLFNDKFKHIRLEAIRTLEAIEHPDSIKALEAALKDEEKTIRDEAQNSIDRLNKIIK